MHSRRWLAPVWMLVLVFMVSGVFGRSLWKADEPYSFGIVWEMLEGKHWLIPHVAGQPFVEKPPLVYWVAAGFAKAMPFWTPDESARAAVLLFAAIGFGALYVLLRYLHREAFTWARFIGREHPRGIAPPMPLEAHAYATLGLLVAAGTVGFAEHVHKLTADVGQLAGAIVGLCGLVLIGAKGRQRTDRHPAGQRQGLVGGMLLGTGAGMAFLSKGLFVPGLLLATTLVSLWVPDVRRRARTSFVAAAAFVLPWLLIWPALLYESSPPLFSEWLWENNIGRFLGFTLLGGNGRTLVDKMASMLAAGFPATLLFAGVAWYTWRAVGHDRIRSAWRLARDAPAHTVVLVYAMVVVSTLVLSASMRDIYILPVLPALVVLGLPMLFLPVAFSTICRRSATVLFYLAAAACVSLWFALVTRGSLADIPVVSALVGAALPLSYALAPTAAAIAAAIAIVLLWGMVVVGDETRSATVAWSAGFAMVWSVVAALLLPWVDFARSYDAVFQQMAPDLAQSKTCVGSVNLGESEIALLAYATGVEPKRWRLGHSGNGARGVANPAIDACDWLVALSNSRSTAFPPDAQRWRSVMSVARPGDHNERLTLYRVRDHADLGNGVP